MVLFSHSIQDTSHKATTTQFVYYSVILQLETMQYKLPNTLINRIKW